MDPFELLDWNLIQAVDDFLFFKGRGAVSLIVVSTTSNPGSVSIYDGIDTNGKLVMTINLKQYDTVPIACVRPLIFKRGIYIDVDAATTSVSINLASLPD